MDSHQNVEASIAGAMADCAAMADDTNSDSSMDQNYAAAADQSPKADYPGTGMM